MRLADRVTTGSQGNGFLIVHCHAGECDPDVVGSPLRVGHTANPLRIHVDQAHLHGGKRVLQRCAIGTVAFVPGRTQPFLLGTPVDVLFRVPDVCPPEREAIHLQSHGLVGDVSGQDEEVCPTYLVAVLALDRPEEATRLVEVGVVRPRVQGCEPLVASATTTTSISNTIGTRGVPRHADHQATIVAPVGRPPWLAIGHEGRKVLLEGCNVKVPDHLAVVEPFSHGIGLAVVLVQDVEVQCIRPPIHRGCASSGECTMRDRTGAGCRVTVALAGHVASSGRPMWSKVRFCVFGHNADRASTRFRTAV